MDSGNFVSRILKQISLKLVVVAGLFLGSLFLFIFIADEAVLEKEDVFDQKVHHLIYQHTTPRLVESMRAATFLGSSYFLFPAYCIVIGTLLAKKKYRYAIDIAVISVSSFIVMELLKRIFHRNRPDLPIIKGITSYSFPSGHSLSSFIFFFILGYLVWKGNLSTTRKVLLIAVLLLVTLAIGISRVVLNVHYATDVIAGFCFGLLWVISSFWLIRRLFPLSVNNVPAR